MRNRPHPSYSLSIYACLALLLSWPAACHAETPENPPAPKPLPQVTEADLKRVPFEYTHDFPWKKTVQEHGPGEAEVGAPPNPEVGGGSDVDFSEMTSGDMIIRAFGEFTREQKQTRNASGEEEVKEVLTMTRNVEIEQLQIKFSLRAQKIKIVQDAKTSRLELIEATGNVEVWTPERSGRGDKLTYETRFGPHGEVQRDLYTIEGSGAGRATLWQGDDVIEAEKFISDRRLDTFRVLGNPVALVTLPADTAPAAASVPAKPAQPASGGGLLPSFSLTPGGRVRMQCDGEIFYEGANGKVHVTRNVVMYVESTPGQASMKLSADETNLYLNVPPPGQPAANASLFSGSLKGIDFNGRVEIKMPGSVMLFDRGRMDLQKNTMLMEMKEPKGEVRIYTKENPAAATGSLFIAPKSLLIDLSTKEITGGPMRTQTFEGDPPSNRPKPSKEK